MIALQQIESFSFSELLSLLDLAEAEIQRREALAERLKTLPVKSLAVSMNTRAALNRLVTAKLGTTNANAPFELSVKQLLVLLEETDWMQFQRLNVRAYIEIRDILNRHGVPLEKYYGTLTEKVDLATKPPKPVARRSSSSVN